MTLIRLLALLIVLALLAVGCARRVDPPEDAVSREMSRRVYGERR